MAKIRDLIDGLAALEEAVATVGPRRIAETVTAELQDAGPAWSGVFRNSWRIVPGDQEVSATIRKPPGFEIGSRANPAPVIRQTVPPLGLKFRATKGNLLRKERTLYRIGNAAEYRLIATDIVPGRTPPRTAPRGWYETYMQGGSLNKTVQVSMDQALRKVKI